MVQGGMLAGQSVRTRSRELTMYRIRYGYINNDLTIIGINQ